MITVIKKKKNNNNNNKKKKKEKDKEKKRMSDETRTWDLYPHTRIWPHGHGGSLTISLQKD